MHTKIRTVIITLIAAGSFATASIVPAVSQADSKSGTGTAKGCPVENNGTPGTVAVGTRIGLFVCGADGEWHFGWLINAAPHKSNLKPVVGQNPRHAPKVHSAGMRLP